MMMAMPLIDSDLAQIDDKGFASIQAKRQAKERAGIEDAPHPERVRMRNMMLSRYAPPFMRKDLLMDARVFMAEPIPGLTREAAEGVREAVHRQYFDTPEGAAAWAHSFSRIWFRVLAVLEKE